MRLRRASWSRIALRSRSAPGNEAKGVGARGGYRDGGGEVSTWHGQVRRLYHNDELLLTVSVEHDADVCMLKQVLSTHLED